MHRCILFGLLTSAFVLQAAEESKPTAKPRLALDVGGHTGRIRGVYFTTDEKRLITVGEDRSVRLWDLASGQSLEVLYLPGEDDQTKRQHARAALSPDGKLLAVMTIVTNGPGKLIYLIDLESRRIARVLDPKQRTVGLTWSPDGKALAVGLPEGVGVWDPHTGKQVHRLSLPGAKRIQSLAYNATGDRLAVGEFGGTLRILETPALKLLTQIEADTRQMQHWVAWNRDGTTLGTLHGTNRLRFWSKDGDARGERRGAFKGNALAFSPTDPGKLLVGSIWFTRGPGGNWRKQLEFADEPDDDSADEASAPDRGIRTVAISRNGLVACAAYQTSKVVVWDTKSPMKGVVREPVVTLRGPGRDIRRVGWGKVGSVLAWSDSLDAAPRPSLDLHDLTTKLAPGGSVVEERRELGGWSLERVSRKEIFLKREGKVIHKFPFPSGLTTMTLLTPKLFAAGNQAGFTVFTIPSGKRVLRSPIEDGTLALSPSPDGKYLVAGGIDQSLRVYSPDRPTPILSVFPAGKEWIAWTPEGYYAASPGGERLMGWLVQETPNQLPTFHPAARFRKIFYRPDVIRKLLDAGSVEKALAALSKGKEKPVELEKVLPPRVRILTPETAIQVKSSTIQVKASAQGTTDHPVQSLQLVVDGRPYEPYRGTRGFRSVEKPTPGERLETWAVTLQPGKHEIRVVAKNALTTAVSDAVEITVAPEEKISASDDLRQALHVLAIGIDDYPGDLQLKCAVNDATKIAQTLGKHSKSLFPRGVFLHLRTNKQADKQGILRAFDDLAKQARPHDVVVVFFAGHGHVEKADGKFYLLPHGVDIDAMEKTAVSETEFKAKLSAVPGQVVLMMDACHSGATKQKGLWKRRATSVTDGVQRSFADEEVGVVVWLAAMGNEYAEEKEGHGLFTRAMMEGLAGAAGKNRKGEVHLASLDAYVFEKVTDWSEGKQRPNCARPPSVYPFSLTKPTKE